MHHCEKAPIERLYRRGSGAWLVFPVIVVLLAAGCHRAESQASKPEALTTANPAAAFGRVEALVIKSRATDKYECVADVLQQLASHPHPTCRDEVVGPHGLQDQLAQARALKMQGNTQDADLVLVALQSRLDPKFKIECLKLDSDCVLTNAQKNYLDIELAPF